MVCYCGKHSIRFRLYLPARGIVEWSIDLIFLLTFDFKKNYSFNQYEKNSKDPSREAEKV